MHDNNELANTTGRLPMSGVVHVIRIADRHDQVRALEAFLSVPTSWLSLPGNLYGLSDAHVKVLEQAVPKINFQYVSKAPQNGQSSSV